MRPTALMLVFNASLIVPGCAATTGPTATPQPTVPANSSTVNPAAEKAPSLGGETCSPLASFCSGPR